MAALGASGGLTLALLLAVCAPDVASAEEGSESSGNKALGLTMMGAIFLVIGMYYLTHYSDHDIRKITWSTINNTLSIFCAVIVFKNASQIADGIFWGYERSPLGARISANRLWTTFWYACLFVAIYGWCAGVGRGLKWRQNVLNSRGYKEAIESYSHEHPSLAHTKSRMKYCLFLAHTTGFAGLSGWGMKTNTPWFKDSPWHCALLIPEAIVWYFVIIQLLHLGRRYAAKNDRFLEKENGKPDELVQLAEEQLEDGENDFFGLFMSFLIVTTMRFAIGGNLPNEEGEEEEMVFKHSPWQAFLMYCTSALFFLGAYAILKWKQRISRELGEEKQGAVTVGHTQSMKEGEKEEEEPDEEEEEREHRAYHILLSPVWQFLGVGKEGYLGIVRLESARTLARVVDMSVNTVSFSFAWCFMYATQWLIAPFFEGEELVLGIVLAMVITLCSCVLVYKLDQLADDSENSEVARKQEHNLQNQHISEEEDMVHRKLMESTGILIGFVWEQCFDTAVAGIADERDLWLKPCLAILTVGVIMPVWLWYIIPMETSSGYILGFLPKTIHWRLEHLKLNQEPAVRNEVKEQVKEVLEVMWNQNEELLTQALKEFLQNPNVPQDRGLDDVLHNFESWRRKTKGCCGHDASSSSASGYQPPAHQPHAPDHHPPHPPHHMPAAGAGAAEAHHPHKPAGL